MRLRSWCADTRGSPCPWSPAMPSRPVQSPAGRGASESRRTTALRAGEPEQVDLRACSRTASGAEHVRKIPEGELSRAGHPGRYHRRHPAGCDHGLGPLEGADASRLGTAAPAARIPLGLAAVRLLAEACAEPGDGRLSWAFPASSGCRHGSCHLQHSYARYRVPLCRAARANRDYPSKSCDCHPGDGRASSIQILGPRKPMWTERVNAHRPLQGRLDAYLEFVVMYLPMRWTKGAGSGT